MILTDIDIEEFIESGDIAIENIQPPDKGHAIHFGPASVDLHLFHIGKKVGSDILIDAKNKESARYKEFEFEELVIHPNEFYLLSTEEKITLSKRVSGFVNGRSSIARLGLNIHLAGFVDPQFSGTITMEVSNFTNRPIRIYAGMRLCQIVFVENRTPCRVGYGEKSDAKYQGQLKPEESKIHQDL